MPDAIALDYETRSEIDLRQHGLDQYTAHYTFRPLLCGWTWIGSGRYFMWDRSEDGVRLPADLRDALLDPHVEKWAFNATFERLTTKRGFGIDTPVQGWRCTMALAYMHSFTGGLEDVGTQMGIPSSEMKLGDDGKRLIRLFTMPQKITAKNPHEWRDHETDPADWQKFREYCVRDVEAENAIRRRLIRYPILPEEWALYEIDQIINDRGKPVDPVFVDHAMKMANRRKAELTKVLRDLTGIANPNSQSQFLPWARARGYPFNDLNKDSIAKSLREHAAKPILSDDLVEAFEYRKWSVRLSTSKHAAILKRYGEGDRLRGLYQFAGASRTNRWAGRAVQTQNLTRTPKIIEEEHRLEFATSIIRSGDYDTLDLFAPEPMEIIVGTVRSAFATKEDEEFVVCDLSSIESVVIGYLAGCERILNVFREGRDVYKDFGQVWMRKPYDEITKHERGISKPAVLGAGFRLSGGELTKEGKRTGLWGYAENMGIDMTRTQSHESVRVFREDYAPEIPQMWRDYEAAIRYVMATRRPKKVGPVTFMLDKPYLVIVLPSGRHMRYYKPRIQTERVFTGQVDEHGEPEFWEREGLTYMGISQVTKKWQRIPTHGGKLTENCFAADTPILTSNGVKPISAAARDDLVWDGETWVCHDGSVMRGVKETIPFGGIRVTPDHRIDVARTWVRAADTNADVASDSFFINYAAPPGWDCDVLPDRVQVRPPGRQESVFDLMNCGPRHRFTVVLPSGRMILAHNCVQAFARDVLAEGIRRAHKRGFNIVGHVHDEIITLRKRGDERYGLDALREAMTAPISWAPGLPLGGAGWVGRFYRKD